MIAVVSSTIFPPPPPDGQAARTWLSAAERLVQTRGTIESLVTIGVSEIVLADNSGSAWDEAAVDQLYPAKVRVYHHHQFQNKGISELYLLLAAVRELPEGAPILKVSGRYTLGRNLGDEMSGADVLARMYYRRGRAVSMSTKAYVVRDRRVYEAFLIRTLRELYGYPARIVGPRSAARIIKHSLAPSRDEYPYDDPPDSIEGPSARALRRLGYHVRHVSALGVEGWVGGSERRFVRE